MLAAAGGGCVADAGGQWVEVGGIGWVATLGTGSVAAAEAVSRAKHKAAYVSFMTVTIHPS